MLVLVLAVAAVPLARLAHQSLNATGASVPVWVEVPAALGGFVVAWRKPGNPLGWIFLSSAAISMLSEDAGYYAVADYRLHHGGLPLGWVALLAQPIGLPKGATSGASDSIQPSRPNFEAEYAEQNS